MITPTLPDLARAAADAVTTLAHTLRDCAREVEARGGQRVARGMLAAHTTQARRALGAMLEVPALSLPACIWIGEAMEGCREHYVRESWALPLMQMAAAAPERDTEPDIHPAFERFVLAPAGDMATTCGDGDA